MMRKLIIGVTIIAVIILCVVGLSELKLLGDNFFTVLSYKYQQNQNSYSYVKFRSVSENKDLLNSALKINEDFLKKTPFEKQNRKELKNAYVLRSFFPNFTSYYSTKKMLENTIFNDIQPFYEKVCSMSLTQQKNYFNDNLSEIKRLFLIDDWDSFDLFCFSLSSIGESKITDAYIVENSALYNSYDSSCVFNIVIVLENNKKFQLGATVSLNNAVPTIQYNGSFGEVFE